MKKIFTLLSIFLLSSAALSAQNYVFVDKDGNVLEDGATITLTDAEEDPFGEGAIIHSGLSVKNVGAPSNYSVRVHNEITRIDNGEIQVCFPTYCHNYSTVGSNKSEEGKLATDEVKDIQSEWLAKAYGECIVTYQAMALQPMANLFVEKGGPKVTVHYIYGESTSMSNAKRDLRPVAYFTLTGHQTTQPRNGVYLVKMSDGTVRKMLVK